MVTTLLHLLNAARLVEASAGDITPFAREVLHLNADTVTIRDAVHGLDCVQVEVLRPKGVVILATTVPMKRLKTCLLQKGHEHHVRYRDVRHGETTLGGQQIKGPRGVRGR